MKRSIAVATLLLVATRSVPSAAYSSFCSNPSRARVLARAAVILPNDSIDTLERRFAVIAPKLGMMPWAVSLEEHGKVLSKTLGLQSPKVSVSIEADWKSGSRLATLTVERTCINDDLEPWHGYWSGVVGHLRSAGYRVVLSR